MRGQPCCTFRTLLICSMCLCAATTTTTTSNTALLPPPPPKIPFESKISSSQQQQQQRHHEQSRNEILPPPPPPLTDPDDNVLLVPLSNKSNSKSAERLNLYDMTSRDVVQEEKQRSTIPPLSTDDQIVVPRRILPPLPQQQRLPPPPPPDSTETDILTSSNQKSLGTTTTNQRTAANVDSLRQSVRIAPSLDSIPTLPLNTHLSGSRPLIQRQQQQQQQQQRGHQLPPPPPQQHADIQKVDATILSQESPPFNAIIPPVQSFSQQPQQRLQQQQQRLPPASGYYAGTSAAAAAASRQRLQRPPPGYRNAANSKKQPALETAASGLQALWKRVEQSLDNLADLEDQFSTGAQRLASSVLHTTIEGTKKRLLQPPPQQNQQQQQQQKQQQSIMDKPEARGVGNSRHALSGATKSSRDVPPVVSVTKAYHNDKKDSEANNGSSKGGKTVDNPGDVIRSARWTNIMSDKQPQKAALRSNGGASHNFPPHDKFSVKPTVEPPLQQQPQGELGKVGTTKQRWPPPPSEQEPPPWSGSSPFAKQQQQQQDTPPIVLQPNEAPRRARPFPEDFSNTQEAPVERRRDPVVARKNSFYDDDEDDKPSLLSRLGSLLPPIPRFPFVFKRRGSFPDYAALDVWKDDDDESPKRSGLFGLFRRAHRKPTLGTSMRKSIQIDSLQSTPPLSDLMDRCDHGKTASLLSKSEIRTCRSIGNSKATLDVVCLVFLLLSVHQMPNVAGIPLPFPLADLFSESLTGLGTALLFTMQTWAPFAFACAYLTARTNDIWNGESAKRLAQSTAIAAKEAGTYGQLYLRLTASHPTVGTIPERLHQAAHAQVIGRVEAARLRAFVSIVLTALILMTVSVVRPIAKELIKSLIGIATLPEWRAWPLPWKELGSHLLVALNLLCQQITKLLASASSGLLENPYQFAFHLSLFIALSAVYFLPSLEHRRPIAAPPAKPTHEEDGSAPGFGSIETLSNMGVSSASRLHLWASSAGIEGTLEKWRTMLPPPTRANHEWISRVMLRQAGYGVLMALLLSMPLLVRTAVGVSSASNTESSRYIFRWDSVLDVAVMLLFTFQLSWKAMRHVLESTGGRPLVHGFLKDLSATMEEVATLRKSYMDLDQVAAISPMKGLAVSDLWVAHSTKRAWAVRGANLECRNGELVVIIGDDGAGKTRLMTAIAESMVFPPKAALSTTKVRGLISMGGVDVTKWSRGQLKKRLGLVLNDVRTVADSAELLSGLTLEEILEPSDGLQILDPSHGAGANERNSMILALKMTGLASSLLPRLPTKLSTVVSASEEDLKPSPLRPRCQVLSPSEWSKLILARVLAQCIFDNDNSARSTDKIDNCLVGSLLLLDDATIHMSEVDEASFLHLLRRTGAACVVTTNKWATGRFADRVIILKDGAVVESGTHAELLNRGPQQSLYASKWLAMTTTN